MRIGILERPAAGPHRRPPFGPVALHVEYLPRQTAIASAAPRSPHRGGIAGFEQRMAGKRRIPHRRNAGLAIGLAIVDDHELFHRGARQRRVRMVLRIAERIEHHHAVRHGRVDRAEAVLAIEPLGHEGDRAGNGAAAQLAGNHGSAARRTASTSAEEAEPARHSDAAPCGAARCRGDLFHEQFVDADAASGSWRAA